MVFEGINCGGERIFCIREFLLYSPIPRLRRSHPSFVDPRRTLLRPVQTSPEPAPPPNEAPTL